MSIVVGVACSTANMTTYAPVDEKTKYPADVLLTAAEKTAEDLGLRVIAGEGSSTFDTREKEVATSSIPRLSYKYSFHVETTAGILSIQANCSSNSTTDESDYTDCGDDRPAQVVKLQAALRKGTLDRAKTEQAQNADFAGFGEGSADAGAGKAASKDDAKPSTGKGTGAKSDEAKAGANDGADKDSAAKTKAKPSAKKK
jgi:hypothetical protein